MPEEFRMGDVLRLRKPHPCGGFEWEVTRLGADLGLRCCQCQRRIMLARATVERRMKAFVSRGDPIDEDKVNAVFNRSESGE
jgi:hypothetical protein